MLVSAAASSLTACNVSGGEGGGETPPATEQEIIFTPNDEPQSAPAETLTDYPVTLDGLKTALNELRAADGAAVSESDILLNDRDYNNDYSIEDFISESHSAGISANEITDEEFRRMTQRPANTSGSKRISAAQAIEDTDYLFRLLRTAYGAYEFFGGSAVFDAAQLELNNKISANYPDGITASALAQLMAESLHFVEDTHFSVGGENMYFEEKYFYRDVLNPVFQRDSKGFYTVQYGDESSTRRYLRQEDEQYVRLTIAPSGELVYGLFALAGEQSAHELPQELILLSDAGEQVYNPQWIMMSCSREQRNGYYSLTEKEGVPVVAINSFYLDSGSFSDINRFLNDAKGLRNEEMIIVDLRNNTGGHDNICSMWLYSLTGGTMVPRSVGYISYISRMNEYIISSNAEAVDDLHSRLDFHKEYPEFMDILTQRTTYQSGNIYAVSPDEGFAEYDGTIFVLFNKHTVSAGELALFEFENMSNVVFVGMNSNGCLLTGGTNAAAPVYLPNSGLQVKYSMMVVTSDIMNGFDSAGYLPDVVVDNVTAVDDIIRCWQYYEQD